MKPVIEFNCDESSDSITEENASKKSFINTFISIILVIILTLMSAYGFIYVKQTVDGSLKIMLYLDGEKIGYVDDIDTISAVMTELTDDIYASTGIVYRFNGKLSYKFDNTIHPIKYYDENELYEMFMEYSSYNFIKAYALYIDDRIMASCKNKDDITSVLEQLQKEQTDLVRSVSIESAIISNDIKIVERICFVNEVITPLQLYKQLISSIGTDNFIRDEQIMQTGQTAEAVSRISDPDQNDQIITGSENSASAVFNISADSTPGTAEDDIAVEAKMAGQADPEEQVIIRYGGLSAESINYNIDYGIPRVYSVIQPKNESDDITLTFKYIKYETVTEDAEQRTVFRYNKFLYKDFETTLEEGEKGINYSTYKLEYAGDKLISRQVISRQILKKPVDRIVVLGTKDYPEAGVTVENYIWPMALIEEPVITSYFGECRPEYDGDAYHFGIDIQVDEGTEIYASNGGVVSYVNRTNSYGIMIIIDHDGGIQTCYPHLCETFVEIGDKVYQGQNIALSGNTGVSTNPHLHFEVRADSVPQEPYDYLIEKPWLEESYK
ncbi:MAG: M23 family metallopeptidase [Eubacteriales bacterium]